jgi:hypothetical protein
VAEVYAANVGASSATPEYGATLESFFYDQDPDVRRAAADAFRQIPPDKLRDAVHLISALIGSPAFAEGLDTLAFRAEQTNALPADVVAELAVHAAHYLQYDGGDFSKRAAGIARSLSLLVSRAYAGCHDPAVRERLLNAIDLMVKYGFYGIDQQLEATPRLSL